MYRRLTALNTNDTYILQHYRIHTTTDLNWQLQRRRPAEEVRPGDSLKRIAAENVIDQLRADKVKASEKRFVLKEICVKMYFIQSKNALTEFRKQQ